MTPPRITASKKDEVIQLRVEKNFLDQLNATAEKKQIPLSGMIRVWLAEKLREQDSIENARRDKWRYERLDQISNNTMLEDGPLLVVHAFPLGGKTRLDLEKIRQFPYNLVPIYDRTPMESRIMQFGLEVTRAWGDKKIREQGFAYKTGETEIVISLASEKPKLYIDHIDSAIAISVNSLCSMFNNNGLAVPYLVYIYLLKAKDYAAWESKTIASSTRPNLFTDERIELPEAIFIDPEQFATEANTGDFLIEQIDEVWHAAGLPCSKSYDNDRKWVRR